MKKKLLFPAVWLITLLSVLFGARSVAYADTTVDKTALQSALQYAEQMEAPDYTVASYDNLHTLYLTYAASVDTMESQAEVDNATAQLLEAINALSPYLTLHAGTNIDGVAAQVTYQGATYTDDAYTLAYGTSVTVTAPEHDGYWFAGWMETVSKRVLSEQATYTFSLAVNTSLTALYFQNDRSALLFGTEGGCVISIIEKTPAQWAEMTDLTELAPAVPYHYGYTNGRWNIEPEVLQQLSEGEFVFVYPVYDETEDTLPVITAPAEDCIRLELHYRYDATEKTGTFIMNSAVPDTIIPENVGMLFYYKKAASFDPTQFYVNNNNKMLVSQFDLLSEEIYITNMRKMTSAYNWAVRGYATYRENGELKTVYSNQVNIVRTEDIHDYRSTGAVAPTCTSDGLTAGEECFICGNVTTPKTVIPALGHDYSAVLTPPTCTESGYLTYTCSRCGDVYTVAPELDPETGEYTHPELLPTAHHYEFNTVITPATLTETGTADTVCTNCGQHREEPYYIATGSCGTNVSYAFDHRTGTLTISGTGAMTDYESPSSSPFYGMENLQHLVIESGVTRIGDGTFYDCTAVSDIILADTVSTIGNCAFYNCSSLTGVPLNEGLTDIDYYAFYGCGMETLSLPATLQNIGNGAFSGCYALTQLRLPGTLDTVAGSAFAGCAALDNVYIEAGINHMESGVFSNCTALTAVTLAEGVTLIENNTFYGCTALSDVQLPNSLFTIGSRAFGGCKALTTISLPSGLNSIESAAFLGCSALADITLPAGLKSIGDTAFADCTGLNTQLPAQLQSIGTEAFRNCRSLTAINVPATLTSLPNSVFSGCSGINTLTLPATLTAIGNYCFYQCGAIASLTIPAATASIGTNAFAGCGGLNAISVDSANAVYDSRNNCQAVIETATDSLLVGCCHTTIPNSITKLDNYAFSGNTALSSISIPSSVTVIGTHVFDGCRSLTSVTVPDSVSTVGEYSFNGCTALASVALPAQLTVISKGLFCDCASLTALTVPASVSTIEQYAFEGCSSLTALSLPNSITSLGTYAFAQCTALQSINIPTGISALPSRVFSDCSALTAVTIPGNIRSIGTYAFAGCTGLTLVDLPNTVTTLSANAFKDCTSLSDIYIRNLGCKIGQNAGTIPEQTVIHSYLSSTAKTYADKYGRTFTTLT